MKPSHAQLKTLWKSTFVASLLTTLLSPSMVLAGRIAPKPQPNPSPQPQPEPSPTPSANGEMEFVITPFSNMEHGWHIFEPGYRAVCSDSQGVVASAKLSVDAAIDGESTESRSAYQALIIRPVTQYIRSGATSGNCELSICLDNNVNEPSAAASCKNVRSLTGGDGERALQFKGQVPYKVEGTKVSMQTGAPGLSAWHPAFGFATPTKAFKDYQSPLVLDMNGDNKIALTDVWDDKVATKKLVRFDMALDGKAQPTGWVQKTDGFLAIDSNNNGKIDNASELFGEYTSAEVLAPKTFKNGFEALAKHDSNHDGKIDSTDQNFGKLLVWIDHNQNGQSEKKELKTLASHKIASISLNFKNLKDTNGQYPLNAGNEVRLQGTFSKTDGTTYEVADVWFKQRRHTDQMTAATRWLLQTPSK